MENKKKFIIEKKAFEITPYLWGTKNISKEQQAYEDSLPVWLVESLYRYYGFEQCKTILKP